MDALTCQYGARNPTEIKCRNDRRWFLAHELVRNLEYVDRTSSFFVFWYCTCAGLVSVIMKENPELSGLPRFRALKCTHYNSIFELSLPHGLCSHRWTLRNFPSPICTSRSKSFSRFCGPTSSAVSKAAPWVFWPITLLTPMKQFHHGHPLPARSCQPGSPGPTTRSENGSGLLVLSCSFGCMCTSNLIQLYTDYFNIPSYTRYITLSYSISIIGTLHFAL